jgi:hypothetical protein
MNFFAKRSTENKVYIFIAAGEKAIARSEGDCKRNVTETRVLRTTETSIKRSENYGLVLCSVCKTPFVAFSNHFVQP